ncbi:uncharacterized protein EI90DRAFT_3297843 [Cantharellus anzutake]|uniref:uncharacterized protein n=1 Tax=Cantharellus anzutake TaxID=1750568 RepID=UPI0019076F27|nr:uncharacterized protein EI90DRAFT_3297843 [Cantharellus anzutake]KAF8307205.1 hypothetical protein EI90DRAFT_3297843 [Cantharellus anzutake]
MVGLRTLLPATLGTPLLNLATYTNLTLSVPARAPAGASAVQGNFLGISIELNIVNTLIGESPESIPKPVINLLSALSSRTAQPLRLRIGGNSVDAGSKYDPNAKKMINFNLNSTFKAVPNLPVTYGPQLLTTLKKLGDVVNGSTNVLGLSLSTPKNVADIIKFVYDSQQVLGDSLLSLQLGNEPDSFPSHGYRPENYTRQQYYDDFRTVTSQFQSSSFGNLVSKPILGAPSFCCSWNLDELVREGFIAQNGGVLNYVLYQHYPKSSCVPNTWDFSYFLEHTNVVQFAQIQAPGIALARAAGKPVILSEFNSVSCGGKRGQSDTFGVAMWTIDFVLSLAINNVTAAYIHTREVGISYNLINPPNPRNPAWSVGPQYYSMLFLAEALKGVPGDPSGSVIVADLNLPTSTTASLAGYAIYDQKGEILQRIVLINYGDIRTTDCSARPAFTFTVPPSILPASNNRTLSTKYFTGGCVTETNASVLTWGGQAVGGDGMLSLGLPAPNESVIACSQGCEVSVPSPSVVLINLDGSH